jgi:hypothetical protein
MRDIYLTVLYKLVWLHWVDTLMRIGKFIGPQITRA